MTAEISNLKQASTSGRTFGIGVIGLGIMGHRMIEAIEGHAGVQVAAGFDPAVSGSQFGFPLMDSAEAVIRHPDVDCVYIASPPNSHLALISSAVDAGKVVFCEKPLTATIREARACVDKVKAVGVPAVVNFPLANAMVTSRIQEIIQASELGVVDRAHLKVRFATWPRNWQSGAVGWLGQPEQGGFAREVLSHFIFLNLRLFGPGVIHAKQVERGEAGVETRVAATIQFGKVTLTVDAAVEGDITDYNRLEITGDRGTVALEDWYRLDYQGQVSERKVALPQQVDALYRLLAGETSHHLATIQEAADVVEIIEGLLL